MKILSWILLFFASYAVAPPPPAVGTQLVNCENIEGLLGTLAKSFPTTCPPCPALNHLWKPVDNPNTETRRECFDGEDNDEDGKTDCQDPDCLKDKRIQQRCQMRAKRPRRVSPTEGD